MPNTYKKSPVLIGIISLLLLSTCAYCAKGFYILLFTTPIDLHSRWVEERYIFHHQDPYDVFFSHIDPSAPMHPPSGRNEDIDPSVGIPSASGYPPWNFFAGYLLYWPSWALVKPYFAGLNLLALVVLVGWASFVGKRAGGNFAGLLLGVSVTAISSICTTLGVGQVGVLLAGLLAGCVMLEERNWYLTAGILAGFAAIKPNLGGPFLCAFLVYRRWRGLIGAIGFIVAGSLVIWSVTGANPVEMVHQMVQGAHLFLAASYGPPNFLAAFGIPLEIATVITTLAGAAAAMALTYHYRRIPLLPLFGMLSAVARFWVYHKADDNIVVVFLLVALGELMVSGRATNITSAVFWAVGIALWLPAKCADFRSIQIFQMLAWGTGLVVLYRAWQAPAADSTINASPVGELEVPEH
jgi:Glycosyltransferase family 87